MPITLESSEDCTLVRLEGECTVTSAAELNRLLLEGFALGDLRLDLELAGEIDITVLQLLWAAGREAERKGVGIAIRMSESAEMAAREAGIDRFPGMTLLG